MGSEHEELPQSTMKGGRSFNGVNKDVMSSTYDQTVPKWPWLVKRFCHSPGIIFDCPTMNLNMSQFGGREGPRVHIKGSTDQSNIRTISSICPSFRLLPPCERSVNTVN